MHFDTETNRRLVGIETDDMVGDVDLVLSLRNALRGATHDRLLVGRKGAEPIFSNQGFDRARPEAGAHLFVKRDDRAIDC
ncbi:MAG: hypothetical protein HZC25_12940 [Rhodospirillales bacterium]|nr:hypothetical protein [Rhodospirillales bacterium]